MIQTVFILLFLWSSLSIGRSLILLGEIPGRREKVIGVGGAPSSTTHNDTLPGL